MPPTEYDSSKAKEVNDIKIMLDLHFSLNQDGIRKLLNSPSLPSLLKDIFPRQLIVASNPLYQIP